MVQTSDAIYTVCYLFLNSSKLLLENGQRSAQFTVHYYIALLRCISCPKGSECIAFLKQFRCCLLSLGKPYNR